jgi:hypothetical protein
VLAALGDANALRWARSAVATRAFMLPMGGGRSSSAMVRGSMPHVRLPRR